MPPVPVARAAARSLYSAVIARMAGCCRERCSVAIMAVGTRFTEVVGCRVPIQQAPMGSVSSPALAVAVADAGGVGSITALG
jgi:hypothetical protein